jgi:hypothetical protein
MNERHCERGSTRLATASNSRSTAVIGGRRVVRRRIASSCRIGEVVGLNSNPRAATVLIPQLWFCRVMPFGRGESRLVVHNDPAASTHEE